MPWIGELLNRNMTSPKSTSPASSSAIPLRPGFAPTEATTSLSKSQSTTMIRRPSRAMASAKRMPPRPTRSSRFRPVTRTGRLSCVAAAHASPIAVEKAAEYRTSGSGDRRNRSGEITTPPRDASTCCEPSGDALPAPVNCDPLGDQNLSSERS